MSLLLLLQCLTVPSCIINLYVSEPHRMPAVAAVGTVVAARKVITSSKKRELQQCTAMCLDLATFLLLTSDTIVGFQRHAVRLPPRKQLRLTDDCSAIAPVPYMRRNSDSGRQHLQ
jgi:hypothetical protein